MNHIRRSEISYEPQRHHPQGAGVPQDRKGEEISDKVLDGGAAVANKVTGNKHADKIENARDAADKHVGRDNDGRGPDTTP